MVNFPPEENGTLFIDGVRGYDLPLGGPFQMSMEKLESSFAMNGVRAIEELNFCSVRDPQLRIEPTHAREFMSDPLIRCHAIVMSAFHHKGPGCNQCRHLRVIKGVS